MKIVQKKVGETPLECLERFRILEGIGALVPMTYAGRLDPMAEGALLILVGDECKDKEKYLGLDKEYEVEIVFGISTDTYDALGLAELNAGKVDFGALNFDISKYVGKFQQPYPPFSSKAVNGEQLHELARDGRLPDEMPTKEVEIYSIEVLGRSSITADELKRRIFMGIDLVKGDFRQAEIRARWNEVLNDDDSNMKFEAIKIRVKCSSGTYMRSLANNIGADIGTDAFALSIKRIAVYPRK